MNVKYGTTSKDMLPKEVTYACTSKECATIEAIDKAKQIHDKLQGKRGKALVDIGTKVLQRHIKGYRLRF